MDFDGMSQHEQRIGRLLGTDSRNEQTHTIDFGKRAALHHAQFLLAAAGVVLRDGHFELNQNLHSRTYVTTKSIRTDDLQRRLLVQDLMTYLHLSDPKLLDRIEVVAGPETGGAVFAETFTELYSAGRVLPGIEFVPIYQDKNSEYGYKLKEEDRSRVKGKRIFFLDDVLGTGFTREVGSWLLSSGKIIASAVLVDRGQKHLPVMYPHYALWTMNIWDAVDKQDCVMCKAKVPITRF